MPQTALPPIAWLRAFEAAARHLSFTAAARELHVTQSAVSQHVRSLEHFLGRRVFERGPRALALTEEGANYLPAVREAFAVLSAGSRAFAGAARGRSVTLQCNMGFAVFRLVPRLGELAAAHPWMRLDLVTPVWDPESTARVADVEIRFARPDGAGRDGLRLTRERSYPVCAPALAARIADGEDWRRMPLFDCAGVLAGWPGWLAAAGEALPEGRPIHRASTFAVSIGAALAGAGLAMAHDGLVGGLLAEGRLARPFEARADMAEGYFLLRPASHMRTPAAAALVDWLLGAFAEPGAEG